MHADYEATHLYGRMCPCSCGNILLERLRRVEKVCVLLDSRSAELIPLIVCQGGREEVFLQEHLSRRGQGEGSVFGQAPILEPAV